MEEVKSRGPYIYSVLESAQAFLSQHPFEELEEPTLESKGLWSSPFFVLWCHSSSWAGQERVEQRWLVWHKAAHQCSASHPRAQAVPSPLARAQAGTEQCHCPRKRLLVQSMMGAPRVAAPDVLWGGFLKGSL